MKSTTFVMNFVMLAIFVTMVGIAATYPPQARFMPFVVGIPGIALCFLQIFLDLCSVRRRKAEPADDRSDVEKARGEMSRYAGRTIESEATAVTESAPDLSSVPPNMVGREILIWAYFLGFVGGILVFGFWMVIPVFLFLFLRNEARLPWLRALLFAAVGTTLLYLVVAKLLRVDLFGGFLTTYLLDLLAG